MQSIIGHFIADGTDVKIPIGFKPDFLLIINQNAVTGEVAKIEWFGEEQGVGKEFQTTIIADDGVTSNVNHAYNAATAEIETLIEVSTPVITNGNLAQTGEWGIQLDGSFMDDSDVIWYQAIRADRVVDHGDAALTLNA